MDRQSGKAALIKVLDFTISVAFPDLGSILTAGLSIKLFKKIVLILNCPINKENSLKLIIFQETVAHKRQAYTDLSVRVFSSSVNIVTEKDIKNIEYSVSWLQKISLEKLLF